MKCILILSLSVAFAAGVLRLPTEKELGAFIRSIPRFPTRQIPLFPPSPLPSLHSEFNRTFRGVYRPYEACSINKTLGLWDFGTIQTPNYPEDYPSDTSCEWVLEGPPDSRIQLTVFDLETQAWFLGYYDYVAFSRDGNFEKVDQFAGDANAKTPFLVDSYENKIGIRFKSNGFINYRGLKLEYVVRPVNETAENKYKVSNDDGVCGRSFILDPMTEAPAVETTTGAAVEESTTAGEEATTQGQRIIGHTPALPHAYPWMVALLINGRSFCGGSVIDDQHIITAAHCTDGAETVTILLGTHNLKASSEEEPGRRVVNVTAENIHQHPKYNEDTVTHDISIIRLPEKLTFDEYIKPICLPNREFVNEFFEKQAVNVTGWGITGDRAGISPDLQVTNVEVMGNGQCRQVFRDVLTGNQICTKTTPTNSPCRGDSGGPLYLRQSGPNGDYLMQVGIVSFGTVTCERGYPVAFTRVTAFLDYINEITGRNL
ncbi:unnamed protein product [Orchesella dallaii]|uniref:Uncharacterized protein n=1 Tax=Orchesella dallaii TaxID=48710 RepID=A0ABP1QWX0_9HEXA